METELPTPTAVAEAEPTASEPVEEAAAPSEPAATEEVTESPWASIRDPYELLDHADIKPVLEKRDRRTEETYKADYESKLASATHNWEASNVNRTMQGLLGSVLEKLEDGEIQGVERVIDKLDRMAEPYKQTFAQQMKGEGAQQMAASFSRTLRDGLDRRTQDDFDDLTGKRTTTWETLIDFVAKGKVEAATKPLKDKIEEKDKAIEQLKVQLREGKGPNLGEGSVGGGKNKWMAMTPQERNRLKTSDPAQAEKLSQEALSEATRVRL